MIRPISVVVAAVAMWALTASAAYLLFPEGNEKTLTGGLKSAYEAYKKGDFAAAVPVFNADNAAHFKDKRQALTMVTVDGAGTTFREFATVDAWETGVWTPQVWRFPAKAG
jgi:hypothetical protein